MGNNDWSKTDPELKSKLYDQGKSNKIILVFTRQTLSNICSLFLTTIYVITKDLNYRNEPAKNLRQIQTLKDWLLNVLTLKVNLSFYKQLFCWFLFNKKLQIQSLSTESIAKHFCSKKAACKMLAKLTPRVNFTNIL